MRRIWTFAGVVVTLALIGGGAVQAGEKANNTIHIDLVSQVDEWMPDATGRVSIYKEFQEDHPNWDEWPVGITWYVKDVFCHTRGFDRQKYEDGGDQFYSLYMAIEEEGELRIIRLASFNTKCQDGSFESGMLLPGFTEEELRSGNVGFGVTLESDDGLVGPNGPLILLSES